MQRECRRNNRFLAASRLRRISGLVLFSSAPRRTPNRSRSAGLGSGFAAGVVLAAFNNLQGAVAGLLGRSVSMTKDLFSLLWQGRGHMETEIQRQHSQTKVRGRLPYHYLLYLPGLICLVWFIQIRASVPQVDLAQFYAAAHIVSAGNVARLYDRDSYTGFEALAGEGNIYYNRPAFHALASVPIVYLSYETYLLLGRIGSYLLLGLALWLIPKWFPGMPYSRALLPCFLPFLWTTATGQDTILLTLIVGYGVHLILHRDKDIQGGAVLALALVKPHILWAVPVALAAQRRWRALAGFAAVAGFLALLSFLLIGSHGVQQWVAVLKAPSTDMHVARMGNPRGIAVHYGVGVAAVFVALTLVSFGVCIWRRSLQTALAAALFAGPMLPPHSYVCDYSASAISALLTPYTALQVLVLLPWHFFAAGPSGIPYALTGCVFLLVMAWRRRT